MDERIRFWRNDGSWPGNAPGYVFLAHAVYEVGKAAHGEAWTGDEPASSDPSGFFRAPLLNGGVVRLSQSSAKPWQKDKIDKLLRWHRPDLERKPIEHGPYGPKPLVFSDDEWEAGLDLVDWEDEGLSAMRGRFNSVVALIVDACAQGVLVSALRPIEGGKISEPMPPHMWQTERAPVRFCRGQMNPRKPFELAVSGDGFQYVYFSKESLDALLRELSDAANPAPDKNVKPPTQDMANTPKADPLPAPPAPRPPWASSPKTALAHIADTAKADGIEPLTQTQMVGILKGLFKKRNRQQLREVCRENGMADGRGPKGPRNPNRDSELEQLRRKLVSA
ncbi:hypothetical protein [Mesorhizobium sp.]|uniref:hypothetical protein n=1 Tax=Mesorhizobium sp. TaxID=1871066 RepID=UPI000FE3A8DC|nr:hypothetical protein [Mesorhizobium sp.]RWQ21572.1 MAG: hypothetical protein EOR92_09370 [Mesorhizobium sp.]